MAWSIPYLDPEVGALGRGGSQQKTEEGSGDEDLLAAKVRGGHLAGSETAFQKRTERAGGGDETAVLAAGNRTTVLMLAGGGLGFM